MARLIDWAAEMAAYDQQRCENDRRERELAAHIRQMWDEFAGFSQQEQADALTEFRVALSGEKPA